MPTRYLALFKRYGFFFIPPLFYITTMARTIGFGDTALLVNDIQRAGLESHVNNHPMTVLTGVIFNALFPFQELAIRASLVSVFYGSLTIAAFYWLLLFELGSVVSAIFGSLLLMLCHSLWWHSTVIENYAASAFLLTVCLNCWRRFERTQKNNWLYALCFFAGLSIFNHVQMGFVCIGVLVTGLITAKREKQFVPILPYCGLAAVGGMLPWLALIVRDAGRTGSFAVTIKGAFVGSFESTFFSGEFWSSITETSYVMWFQSPTLYMTLFGAAGIYLLYKESPKSASFWGIMAPLLINTTNFCFYPTWDKYAFLLESFVILHFFASRALHELLKRTRAQAAPRYATYVFIGLSLVVPPFLYGNVATWAANPDSVWHHRYNNIYSENVYQQSEFIANPNKRGFSDVEKFAHLLFAKLPKDATFLDDDSRTYYPLADYFQKHYKMRQDLSILLVNSWGIANWGLSSDTIAEIITKAYYLDKPFFAISNKVPINGFIMQAQKKVPEIEFVKFPIEDNRWVYRLVTQSEKAGNRRIALEDMAWIPTLNVSAPSGYFDLSPKDIIFFSTGSAELQNMSNFVGHWHSNDHLFFKGEKPGAGVEFYLKSNDTRLVDLTFWLTSAPDFAKVKMEINKSEATADLFESVVQPTKISLSSVALTPGINKIKLTVLEKNPSSKGYHFAIDGVEYLTRKIEKP